MRKTRIPWNFHIHCNEFDSAWIGYCLIGLVVKASASGAEDPRFESRLQRDFSRSSHTSGLEIGTPVATLPGAWHDRVSWDWLAWCKYTVTG